MEQTCSGTITVLNCGYKIWTCQSSDLSIEHDNIFINYLVSTYKELNSALAIPELEYLLVSAP